LVTRPHKLDPALGANYCLDLKIIAVFLDEPVIQKMLTHV